MPLIPEERLPPLDVAGVVCFLLWHVHFLFSGLFALRRARWRRALLCRGNRNVWFGIVNAMQCCVAH